MSALSASRSILTVAGLLLAAATACGAFGAHALQNRLAPDRLHVYDTAVRYHFFHALGLLAIGLAARTLDSGLLRWSAILVIAGVLVFSGTLYALALGAPRLLGAVTPLGGLALIAGWIVFAIGVWRHAG
jgi:uncharacterized membrane protein YgdD (TMEM256/DUF423 family)